MSPSTTPSRPASEDAIASAARRAVSQVVKARARQYARRPLALETLYPGLSAAPAETLIAIADHLVERESQAPRRWFGFGGEVPLINAKAARLLGRAIRRAAMAPVSAPAPCVDDAPRR